MRCRRRVLLGLLVAGSLTAAPASALACTDSWIGASDGAWSDGSRWTKGYAPLAADDACITVPGTYTITLGPYFHQDNLQIQGGGTVRSLTLGGDGVGGTQTLVIAGQSYPDAGNTTQNAVGLDISGGSASIATSARLVLDSTGGGTRVSPTDGVGGTAFVSTHGATITNRGRIVSQMEGPTYPSVLAGTLVNQGSLTVSTGTLEQNTGTATTNTGRVTVSPGATFNIYSAGSFAGATSFENDGDFANDGTTHFDGVGRDDVVWTQRGGALSGNPIELRTHAKLVDSGGSGAFVFGLDSGILTGTIPAGQTVTVRGTSTINRNNQTSNGTGIDLDAGTLTNEGTLVLDATGDGRTVDPSEPGGGPAVLDHGSLVNRGTLISRTESTAFPRNGLHGSLVNAHGALVDVQSGTLRQSSYETTNSGTLRVAPAAVYEVADGGSLTSAADGTLAPQISASTSYGTVQVDPGATFTAGGTLAPGLTGGYAPAAGTAFPVVTIAGTRVGSFGATANGFRADDSRPAYIAAVYGSAPAATVPATSKPAPSASTPARAPGGRVARVSAISATRGRLAVGLSCPSGGAATCSKLTVTASTTARRPVLVARKSVTLPAGASRTLTVPLTSKGRTLLRRRRSLRTRVRVVADGRTLRSATVTIRATARKRAR